MAVILCLLLVACFVCVVICVMEEFESPVLIVVTFVLLLTTLVLTLVGAGAFA
jgi:hypothetical protein